VKFPWNEWNEEHIAKHGISPKEAEADRAGKAPCEEGPDMKTNKKTNRRATRKKPVKSLLTMDAAELEEATAEFDEEFVADSFGKPTAEQNAQLQRAKRRRGRPKVGQGVQVISVSIEKGLLSKTDRLAKKLKVKRATLISRGLQAILNEEVTVDV
jgi:hypothetical protein